MKKLNTAWGKRNSFYDTARWRRVSIQVRKDKPLCEHCQQNGFIEPSTQTDHIVPIEHGGDKFNYHNLQALCDKCHARKTQKDKRKYE